MEAVVRFVIGVIVIVVFVIILMPKPAFVIVIENGRPKVERGKVSKAFVEDCRKLCAEAGIGNGIIKGKRKSGRITLWFSRHIPKVNHQQFRNAWNIYL